jgi:hypothetical protein
LARAPGDERRHRAPGAPPASEGADFQLDTAVPGGAEAATDRTAAARPPL